MTYRPSSTTPAHATCNQNAETISFRAPTSTGPFTLAPASTSHAIVSMHARELATCRAVSLSCAQKYSQLPVTKTATDATRAYTLWPGEERRHRVQRATAWPPVYHFRKLQTAGSGAETHNHTYQTRCTHYAALLKTIWNTRTQSTHIITRYRN